MATSKALIDAISRAVQDAKFQKRTTDIYAQILTDAQDYLTDQLEPLIKVDKTSIIPVAGTYQYSMPSDFVKFETRSSHISRGWVAFGTNGDIPLKKISVGILDTYTPRWRSLASNPTSVPNNFALEMVAGQAQLIIWPPPSAASITTYGAVVWLRYIPRSAALNYDGILPFDNTDRLRSLDYLLKIHSIWQISLEDQQFDKANKTYEILMERVELAKDVIESTLLIPESVGFSPFGKNIL